jgi:hypothetical protein
MAKYNETKLQSAERVLASITGKAHANNNVSMYRVPSNMLIDAYRDKLAASVLKKHKELSKRDLTKSYGNPLYANMSSTYAPEKGITFLQSQTMLVNALKGKFDKKFIKELLDSTENYLVQNAKKKASKA